MKKLERSLGRWSVVAISLSAMLGSGIFVLPGLAVAMTGSSAYLAYLLAGIAILPAAMSKSELATAMPTSGGTYVYLDRTFGPLVGTIAGLGLWLSLILKSSFALIGFGSYLSVLTDHNITLPLLILITFINIFGIGKIGKILSVNVLLTIGFLIILSLFCYFNVQAPTPAPLFLNGPNGFFEATALVFISYAGVTKVAAIAEEIKNPKKNLPKGILTSLAIAIFLYTSISFVLGHYLSFSELSMNLRPIYTLSLKMGGENLALVAAVVAIFTMTSMANAGLMAASRFPFAMSRDNLLPSIIGKLYPKTLTPLASILITSLFMAFFVLNFEVSKIVKMASSFMIMIYMWENFAVIILRESRAQWYKPSYTSPFYPGIQIIGILASFFLLIEMGSIVITSIAGALIPGVIVFLIYGKNKTTRKGILGIRGRRLDVTQKEENFTSKIEEIIFSEDANVLVTLFGSEKSPEMLTEIASHFNNAGKIEVTYLTEAPEQTELSDFAEDPPHLKSVRRRIHAMAEEKKQPICFDAVVSHDISKTIYDLADRFHCQWLFKEWEGRTKETFTFHNPVGWLKNHLDGHLAVFSDSGVRYVRKILVYTKKGDDIPLLINAAKTLSSAYSARVVFSSFLDKGLEESESDIEHILQEQMQFFGEKSKIEVIKGKSWSDKLIQRSAEFDLLLIQTEGRSLWETLWGSGYSKVMTNATCSVLSLQPAKIKNT